MAKDDKISIRIESILVQCLIEEGGPRGENIAAITRRIVLERYFRQDLPGFVRTDVAAAVNFNFAKATSRTGTSRQATAPPTIAPEFSAPAHLLAPPGASAAHPTKPSARRRPSARSGKAPKKQSP